MNEATGLESSFLKSWGGWDGDVESLIFYAENTEEGLNLTGYAKFLLADHNDKIFTSMVLNLVDSSVEFFTEGTFTVRYKVQLTVQLT